VVLSDAALRPFPSDGAWLQHILACLTPAPLTCRAALLKLEEDWISNVCTQIAKFKPDVVVTEKGLSDLAIHFLTKAGISAIRRLRKTGQGLHETARQSCAAHP
jgi:TCP-1/cpn60 chaperonin family